MPLSQIQTQEQQPPFFEAVKDAYSCKEDDSQFEFNVVVGKNTTTLYLTRKEVEKKFRIPSAMDFGVTSDYLK